MVKNITYYVEILCKTICKTLRIFLAKIRVKLLFNKNQCKNFIYSHLKSPFSTIFLTIKSPLFSINFFHYFTYPTITTTNKLIGRI